jgi:magnesium and cobalt transporter
LKDDEHETIGGFFVHQLGHMPKKGERLEYGSFRFEVLHADDRRVYLLKLKLIKD